MFASVFGINLGDLAYNDIAATMRSPS
jgi:hypothetical protein